MVPYNAVEKKQSGVKYLLHVFRNFLDVKDLQIIYVVTNAIELHQNPSPSNFFGGVYKSFIHSEPFRNGY